MVLKRLLKDAYKSGRFSSSKVKRSGRSVEELDKIMAGVMTGDGATDPDRCVEVDIGARVGLQENVKTGGGPEFGG